MGCSWCIPCRTGMQCPRQTRGLVRWLGLLLEIPLDIFLDWIFWDSSWNCRTIQQYLQLWSGYRYLPFESIYDFVYFFSTQTLHAWMKISGAGHGWFFRQERTSRNCRSLLIWLIQRAGDPGIQLQRPKRGGWSNFWLFWKRFQPMETNLWAFPSRFIGWASSDRFLAGC